MSAILASLFGKETLIGLDIGSAYLKAVQVEAHRESFRVTRAAQQKMPVGAMRDGVILDRDAVAGAIRQMLKSASISATGAVLSVSGPTVVVRQITLPKMTEAALRKSARYEASKYITANIDDSAIAFDIIGPVEDDPNLMNVMLVAAPRDMVESRIDVVERTGLEAVAVDIEAFALQRSLVDCNRMRYNDGALRAFVDMGASHTEVTLVIGSQFGLTRSINIAGDTFTDAIKNQLRLDVAEAERRKTEVDLNVLLNPGSATDPQAGEAPRAIQSILDELLREVRRSINFYQSQQPEGADPKPLAEIILSGGNAQLGGLAPYMMARLGTEVRLADVFDSTAFEAAPEAEAWLREQAPRLGIAAGLAVKEHLATPVVLNTKL
ncbi:MAG: type IV pilus assembly protein PilM [Cytophagales bacterium]|nr:type IV pilus assembly protein PilM [Armatimonadota bacterium]